jgi:alpha-galactosidase
MENAIKKFRLGRMIVEYFTGTEEQAPGLRLRFAGKPNAKGRTPEVLPLVQVALRGDVASAGFAPGQTMCLGETTRSFRWCRQRVFRDGRKVKIITILRGRKGLECEHTLSWQRGGRCLVISTRLTNRGRESLTVEHLSSFCLGGIDGGRILRHRIRSSWSSEGQHEVSPLVAIQMERSPTGHSVQAERFGQVGSMPVRGFFPFLALEDAATKTFWGARLAWAGSWQMETFRRKGGLAISGGLADREFGHWWKTLKRNESLLAPDAHVAVGVGDFDEFCRQLLEPQISPVASPPDSERDLPILFNEFCTTWGRPTEENVKPLVDRLRGTPVKYFVLDAGWYDALGDWRIKEKIYPSGFSSLVAYIKEAGMTAGLWFEPEVACAGAELFGRCDWLLKLDGAIIQSGERRFVDMRLPAVKKYLDERVIGLLKKQGVGYVKIDYNEPLGIGCDGEESPGEGLRQTLMATQDFFGRMREKLPSLVVENCASGGHRLEPSLLALSAMSSFSDAHEVPEIPLIAANLHRVMLPRQSQVWAVLRAKDALRRIVYSLAATFLGRMCLSGEVHLLSGQQWELVERGMALYQKAAPLIARGKSRIFRHGNGSLREPDGWQAVLRANERNDRLLVVAHRFAKPVIGDVEIELPAGRWQVEDGLSLPSSAPGIRHGKLNIKLPREFSGEVLLLRRVG